MSRNDSVRSALRAAPTGWHSGHSVAIGAAAIVVATIAFWPGVTVTKCIDSRSGRLLMRKTLFGRLMSEEVSDTPFSKTVSMSAPGAPEWHRYCETSRFAPVSPYYRFHVVPTYLKRLMIVVRENGDRDAPSLCRPALALLSARDVDGLERYVSSVEQELRKPDDQFPGR